MRPISSSNTVEAAMMPSLSPPAMAQPRSPWHSPMPYLFGGLAAMLGLIAFALLILACSYWRLSGRSDNHREGGEAERDVESGESTKPVKVCEEKILVIMAGEENPTFLATPVYPKASPLGDKNGKFEDKEKSEKPGSGKKVKEEMGGDGGNENHDSQPTRNQN